MARSMRVGFLHDKVALPSFLVAALILPLLVIMLVWYPLVSTYYVRVGDIDDVATEKSRHYPSDQLARKLSKFSLGVLLSGVTDKRALEIADLLIKGGVFLPELLDVKITSSFEMRHATSGPSNLQLAYSGLFVPALLTRAYSATENEDYLVAARDFILDFGSYEESLYLPTGFVWNDHAVASSASVIADFWWRYKKSAIYTKGDAKKILKIVGRRAAFLNNRKLYTFHTNHGFMQNLALLKLAMYFPLLADMEHYKTESLDRIREHLRYFINSEGAVLEHSAEYHEFGVELTATALEFYRLSGQKVDSWMEVRHENAELFLAQLQRPDGSLPGVGDTAISLDKSTTKMVAEMTTDGKVSAARVPSDSVVLKKAGYAIWWNGLATRSLYNDLSQTTIAWSNFSFFGHKHADELSINIWSGGQDWWTGVGYWPYTSSLRTQAIGWSGANAPHFIGEDSNSIRRSIILAEGVSKKDRFIDLIRKEESGFSARRQIVQLEENKWIVIDSLSDKNDRKSRTVWTAGSSIVMEQCDDCNTSKYLMRSTKTGGVMGVQLASSGDSVISQVSGSLEPLAGWIAAGEAIKKTPAIIVEQPSNVDWSLMFFERGAFSSANMLNDVSMKQWASQEEWTVEIKGGMTVSRAADVLTIGNGEGGRRAVKLSNVDPSEQVDNQLIEVFENAATKYGKKTRPLIRYRMKISYVIIIGALFFAVILLYVFYKHKQHTLMLNISTIVVWVCVGSWLFGVYFVT